MGAERQDDALRYQPEIDGLRGLAVSAVLLNHVDPHLLSGGYVGVDVFFVISGFLITRIILRDMEAKTFSFLHFFARRVKRLMPAAIVMGVTVLAVGAFLFLPRDFKNLGGTTAAYVAMLSNFVFWRTDDYFEAQNRFWPLLHTWSLAVEEQFYLVFPIVLWLLRRSRVVLVLPVLCFLLLVSFAISVWSVNEFPSAAYYLLSSRSWELLGGAVVSCLSPCTVSRAVGVMVGSIATALITVPMLAFNHSTPFPGAAALSPVVGTSALLWLSTNKAANDILTVLRWGPLVAIGQLSYSLYLWHWPLLIFAKYPWSAAPSTCPPAVPYLAAVVSLVISWLSYRYVENPGRKLHIGDGSVLLTALVCCGVLFGLGATVYRCQGFPGRFSPEVIRFADGLSDINPMRDKTMYLSNSRIEAGEAAKIGDVNGSASPLFMLWGDSHADVLAPLCDSVAKRARVSGYCLCRAATPPLLGLRIVQPDGHSVDHEFAPAVIEFMRRRAVPYVVLCAKWQAYAEARLWEGDAEAEGQDEKHRALADALARTFQTLRACGVRRIWIVRNVPRQPFSVPRQLALSAILRAAPPNGVTQEQYEIDMSGMDALFDSVSSSDVEVVDLAPAIFATGGGLLTKEGYPMYYDGHHLSWHGAMGLGQAIEPLFKFIVDGEAEHAASSE